MCTCARIVHGHTQPSCTLEWISYPLLADVDVFIMLAEEALYMSKVEQSSGTQFSAWLVHQAGALIKQGMAVVVMGIGMYWTGVDVIAGRLPPGDFVAIAAYVAQVRSRAVAAHLRPDDRDHGSRRRARPVVPQSELLGGCLRARYCLPSLLLWPLSEAVWEPATRSDCASVFFSPCVPPLPWA